MDIVEYNADRKQQFFFAEVGKDHRTCSSRGEIFQEVPRPRLEDTYTEYDLQKENGILEWLESTRSYTYSLWPDSTIKTEIEMQFYQRPIYNYKLACEADPDTSFQALQDLINGP